MEILFFFLGIIIGGLVSILFVQNIHNRKKTIIQDQLNEKEEKINHYQAQHQVFVEKNEQLKQLLGECKSAQEKDQESIIQLNKKLSTTEADYKNLKEKLTEQRSEVEKLQEKFAIEFKNLANEIFEDKSKKFTDQNRLNLGELLNPLKDKIVEFEKKIEITNKENLNWNATLKEQISGLKEMNLQITKEAENLTKALKGESKVQGGWGEFILESILDKSGLVKGREYFVQESLKADNGKRLQPDVIIKLPEDKNIIIDAKVSLVAYEKYFNEDNEEKRYAELKNHLISIKNHIKNLGSKNYQGLYQIKSLDFVLMFIPVEPAFSLAIQYEANLFNDAFDKNIVIVSPSTLLATLRTIASIWRQEHQNENALEIARQGGDLYDKFVGFVQDLNDLGNKINTTRDCYDKAMNKLVEGRGNLVSRAEKIKKLGANASKSIPSDLLEKSEKEFLD